jgi:HEAT repeat protein
MPEELSQSVVRALVTETAPDVSAVLASVTSDFVRLALRKTDFAELERILLAVEAAPRRDDSASEHVHLAFLAQNILQETNFRRLVEVALDNRPLDSALPRILARDPTRVLDHLSSVLALPGGVESLPAMARLLRAIGEPAIGALVTQVFDPRSPRATAAVKMLAATRPERLVEVLPRALPSWDWNLQDMAVSELTRIQPPGLPAALLEAMPHAHPLVIPMMVDEVGLARETSAMPLLMEIASGQHERFRDVFVRIKAIEALGRLCAPEAAELLRNILRTRTGLMHVEPAGLRAAAEEALAMIENRPSSARVRAKYDETARVSKEFAGQPGTRARRYLRIPLDEPLPARIVAASASGSASVRVQTLSLGGAFLESNRRLNIGDALTVEVKAGLRSFQSTAVVRNITPAGSGVEFVHMKQDDREKLRRLLSRLSRP